MVAKLTNVTRQDCTRAPSKLSESVSGLVSELGETRDVCASENIRSRGKEKPQQQEGRGTEIGRIDEREHESHNQCFGRFYDKQFQMFFLYIFCSQP